MRALIRQLRPAFLTVIVFTLVCGVAFPLLSTLIGQVAFGDKADGSLIRRDGVVIESMSTLRFRGRSEIEEFLVREGFELTEIRDAPDRPGGEFVFVSRRAS